MTSFQDARAFLLKHRTDYDAAVKGFRWPDPAPFNWALDWFDAELARNPDSRDRAALWIVDVGHKETKLSFAALSARSRRSSPNRWSSCSCMSRSARTRSSMSGIPERGKRGAAPCAIARAAWVMSVSGCAIDRAAILETVRTGASGIGRGERILRV